MNRIILIFLCCATAFSKIDAQEANKPSWRKTNDNWEQKHSIVLTASILGVGGYNSFGLFYPHFNLEYDRIAFHNVSFSAIALYAPMKFTFATDTYTQTENFYCIGAKVNYNLPVLRNWLYLRTGLGFGAGYHNIIDYSMVGTTPEPSPKDIIKPHIIADVYWVFRATKRLELRFAPLIISPSQIIFGSKFNKPYNDMTFFYTGMYTIGASLRF